MPYTVPKLLAKLQMNNYLFKNNDLFAAIDNTSKFFYFNDECNNGMQHQTFKSSNGS